MGLLTSHSGGTRYREVAPILIDDNGLFAKPYRVGQHGTFLINREEKIVDKTFSENLWTSKSMETLIQHL
jgi:hypothetical protein